MSWNLGRDDICSYHENGFLIVRGGFREEEMRCFDRAILRCAKAPGCLSTDRKSRYPERSKYTIASEGLLDPDLAFIADDPSILDAVETLLGKPPSLSAFVSYLRTPGDRGSAADYQGSSQTAHCDYKPFRPAGSSLDWLFVILALSDYTPEIGPLYVSPGSHQMSRTRVEGRITHVERARAEQVPPLVDAKLRRGDLLFMNMFTWHEAPGNRSGQDRWGIYNKYTAIDAPPASGPFLFSDAAFQMLGDRGRASMRHHTDRPIATTRLVLEHDDRVLLVRSTDPSSPDCGQWTLPGGAAEQIDIISDWDVGNVIASLEARVLELLGVEIDWMTYVGDYREGDGLCRVYGRPLDEPIELSPPESLETRWVGEGELASDAWRDRMSSGFELEAIRSWLDDPVLRGIGQSQSRAGLTPAYVAPVEGREER